MKTDAMVAKLRSLPGVEAVGGRGADPARRQRRHLGISRRTSPVRARKIRRVERYSVTPDYFKVMRIPLRRGRLFTDADRAGVEHVMVIGERTAQHESGRTPIRSDST